METLMTDRLENLLRETRETMIESNARVEGRLARLEEELERHAIASIEHQKTLRSEILALKTSVDGKFSEYEIIKQQAIGASKAVKAAWAVGSALGVAGIVKIMHVTGLLPR